MDSGHQRHKEAQGGKGKAGSAGKGAEVTGITDSITQINIFIKGNGPTDSQESILPY